MKGFFDKLGKDVQKAFNNNNNSNNHNRGGGKSLGGMKAGTVIPNIIIDKAGPIGIRLENTTDNNSAIIASVTPDSIAAKVGLKRGDVVCYVDTNGQREYKYSDFLKLVKSNVRPLLFDVRRTIITGTGTCSSNTTNNSTPAGAKEPNSRADADARKQAIIAAAEQRNSQHKAKIRPISKFKGGKPVVELSPEELGKIELQKQENMKRNAQHHMNNEPKSMQAKEAIQAAKREEIQHMNSLGYNPYEVRKVSAGQANSASIAMTHGSITAPSSVGSNNLETIPVVRPPPEALESEFNSQQMIDPTGTFDNALDEILTSNPTKKTNISKTLRILKKIITNVMPSSAANNNILAMDDPKRKIRITNPNNIIQSCVVDMNGSIELLMSVGFVMMEMEQENEKEHATFLFYDADSSDNGGASSAVTWLNEALSKMEQMENEYKQS